MGRKKVVVPAAASSSKKRQPRKVKAPSPPPSEEDSSSSEDTDDWEEVVAPEEVEGEEPKPGPSIPPEGLVITIPRDSVLKKTPDYDPNEELRIRLNRKIKLRQLNLHKVSLLTLLARGIQLNDMLRSEELKALALSILTDPRIKDRPKFVSLPYIQKLLTNVRTNFNRRGGIVIEFLNDENSFDDDENLDHLETLITNCLENSLERYKVSRLHKVLLMVLILRSLKIDARLVWSLQPLPMRPPAGDLLKREKPLDPDEDKSENKDVKQTPKKKQEKVIKKKVSDKSKGRKMISNSPPDEIMAFMAKRKDLLKPSDFGNDYWLEVYLEEERRWASVEVESGRLLGDYELEAGATKPMLYVLAFDGDGRVKDVTRRYAKYWLSQTQGKRVDSEWWDESLDPFKVQPTSRDKKEDDFLDNLNLSEAMPTNVYEFKNHPLYVLRRNLNRFEEIYPLDTPPVGSMKEIPVYKRTSIMKLHSRSKWKQEGKSVRIGEVAHKLIKARPKFDRSTKERAPDSQTELFGEWQVEDYMPPIAKDGKVPRNEFGNVELFQPQMLPVGTVHLLYPGLQRVANKLGIDCSPAVTGFESGRFSYPVFDGFVVCEEFRDILVDAWNEDREIQEKKAKEKIVTRARANWRRLFRLVFLQIRLRRKYNVDLTEVPMPNSAKSPKKRKRDDSPFSNGSKKRK